MDLHLLHFPTSLQVKRLAPKGKKMRMDRPFILGFCKHLTFDIVFFFLIDKFLNFLIDFDFFGCGISVGPFTIVWCGGGSFGRIVGGFVGFEGSGGIVMTIVGCGGGSIGRLGRGFVGFEGSIGRIGRGFVGFQWVGSCGVSTGDGGG